MSTAQSFAAIILSLALLMTIIQLIRGRRLREEYALLWLTTGVVILILSVSPGIVELLKGVFDVTYGPTLVLSFGLFFSLLILLSHSVIVTALADKNRDLAQAISILDWQVRQLEAHMSPESNSAPEIKNGHNQVAALVSAIVAAHPETERPDPEPVRPRRVLVIGLDGATFDLIEPWVAQGHLPTLGRLIREGAHGRLRSTTPPMTAPAWTSFGTGTNPGKHGLYDWIARKGETYKFAPVTAVDARVPTIYTLLSQAGRRVCVHNVPMTYPPVPVNGVMVSGMPAPSTRVTFTYPATLYQDMLRAIGDYVLYPDPGQAYSPAGVDAFLKRLYRAGELRQRAFDYLRGREKWDFAMLVFNGTDTVSHAMWKYMDPSHPLHDPALRGKYGNAIRDYYRFVDDYLSKVVDELEDDTTLIVMSDHGFGPFHKFIHVNNWLIQSGHMKLRRGLGSRVKAGLFGLGFTPMNVYDTMMRVGLGALKREVVRGQGQGLLKTFFLSFEDVDWSRTRAYSLGNIGQINLNVAGREPSGCIQPGPEYERVRDEIIAGLRELRDPETGELVVESIYRREEIYRGDQLEKAPDIVFIPRRLEYFGFGEYEFGSHKVIEAMRRGISGTHRMEGIFLAYGKAVRPGVTTAGAQIVDLAPTILALMGEPAPEHMDGRVLDEIIRDPIAADGSAEPRVRWEAGATNGVAHFTEEEEEILTERLRNLGYVG